MERPCKFPVGFLLTYSLGQERLFSLLRCGFLLGAPLAGQLHGVAD